MNGLISPQLLARAKFTALGLCILLYMQQTLSSQENTESHSTVLRLAKGIKITGAQSGET